MWTPKDRTQCPHHRGDTIYEHQRTVPSVRNTELCVSQSNMIQTRKEQSQVSALQPWCQYYSQTSLIWTCDRTKCPHHRGVRITVEPPDRDTNETAKCPHHRGVRITVEPPDTDTKGTEPSVLITEVSVLESSLLIQRPMRQSRVSGLQRSLFCSQSS